MNLSNMLILYVAIVFSITLVLFKAGWRKLPSIILSLIIGQISLNFLYPASLISDTDSLNSTLAFYYSIQYLTPIFAFLTLLYYIIKDRKIIDPE